MPNATSAPHSRHDRPPAWPLFATDALRAACECASLAAAPWLAAAPRGDGHPVLVLPGFLAGDGLTAPLRAFLRAHGWAPQGWRAGINWGRWDALDAIVLPELERLAQRHGCKVSLVGASMGGIYARAAAERLPQLVRCVVTLASAARDPGHANHVWPLYEALTRQAAESMCAPPPPVPSTSVYSTLDGMADWRPCLQPLAPQRENVGIASSHSGMSAHPAAFWLVADRLAQPEGGWQPFTPPSWIEDCFAFRPPD